MHSISKEFFIIALLVMIVIFMIGMVFYKYMPNNKTIPDPVTYTADVYTTEVLQEISASNDYSYSNENKEVDDIIKSYSIGATELSTAASKKTYVSGKTNPFAEYKEESTNPENSKANGNNTNNVDTTKSSSTGKFFENKSSK